MRRTPTLLGVPPWEPREGYGRGCRGWALLVVLGPAIPWIFRNVGGGGSAHPPWDHHPAEAVGAQALSSVGASAPAGASVPASDPGGQTGDSFGQRASVLVPNVSGAEATDSIDGLRLPEESLEALGTQADEEKEGFSCQAVPCHA